MSIAVHHRDSRQMIGLMFLNARRLGQLATESEHALSSALVGAMAEEICTMRWALASIVEAIELRSPERKEAVLQDLRQALRDSPYSSNDLASSDQSGDIADFLFNVLEMKQPPDRAFLAAE